MFTSVDLSVFKDRISALCICNIVLHGRGRAVSSPVCAGLFKKHTNTVEICPDDSPFLHARVKTVNLGTFLSFMTTNCIRAGPSLSHAGAFLSLQRYQRLRGEQNFAAIGAPNVVCSGTFERQVNWEALLALPCSTHSDKFPGCAISAPPEIAQGATAECYRSSKFIIAGIRSPQALHTLLEWLLSSLPFLEAARAAAGTAAADAAEDQRILPKDAAQCLLGRHAHQ